MPISNLCKEPRISPENNTNKLIKITNMRSTEVRRIKETCLGRHGRRQLLTLLVSKETQRAETIDIKRLHFAKGVRWKRVQRIDNESVLPSTTTNSHRFVYHIICGSKVKKGCLRRSPAKAVG